MYLLPNKNKIDDDGIVEAMKDGNSNTCYFLDTASGEVGIIDGKKDKSKLAKLRGDSRYIAIPKISDEKWRKIFRDFVEMCEDWDNSATGKLFGKEFAKGGNVRKNCVAILEKREKIDGLIYGWRQFEADSLWEEMRKWFSSLPIEIEDDWKSELDCDCELCKLLKEGDHTVGDFMEASQKEDRKRKNKNQGKK